jgi:hypothetical protein
LDELVDALHSKELSIVVVSGKITRAVHFRMESKGSGTDSSTERKKEQH